MKLKIKTFSASGNIFSLIDNRDTNIEKAYFVNNIAELCNNKSMQTDGLIVINKSDTNNFNVLFINPDATTGMMCGNGGRAAIFYYTNLLKNYSDREIVSFDINDITYFGFTANSLTSIYFDVPSKLEKKVITIEHTKYEGVFLNTGTPHFVISVDNLQEIDVEKIGKSIRYHKKFAPEGTNVNFIQKESLLKIYLRTFERGVEKETGACGTGAIAVASIHYIMNGNAGIIGGYKPKLTIIPTSNSKLIVELDTLDAVSKIILTGEVKEI